MTTRPSTEAMRRHLKLATKSALNAAAGAAGIVAARLTRVGESALSFYGSLSDEHAHRFVPLDVALDLDFTAGDPVHARALANAQGYRLVADFPQGAAGGFCLADVARLAAEYHQVQACCFAALEDSDISPEERVAILDKLAEFDRCSAAIRAKLREAA